jgi:hypothetical protein
MSIEIATQPFTSDDATIPLLRTHTHRCRVGSFTYLCRTGVSPAYKFTYSHKRFGTVVWHK